MSETGEPESGWPVSVKAVIGWGGRFVVLRNERREWELPGGRLDAGDADLPAALRRELHEELDLDAVVGPLIDTWIYQVGGRRVVIVTYGCSAERPEALWHSDEHDKVDLLTLEQLRESSIPAGYLDSIAAAIEIGAADGRNDEDREVGT